MIFLMSQNYETLSQTLDFLSQICVIIINYEIVSRKLSCNYALKHRYICKIVDLYSIMIILT